MKYLSWGESFDDTCNYRLVFLCVLRVSFCPSGDSTSLRSRTTFRACCFTISKNPRIELFEVVKPPKKDKRIESLNLSRAFVQRITTEHTIEITTNNERTHGSSCRFSEFMVSRSTVPSKRANTFNKYSPLRGKQGLRATYKGVSNSSR